MQCTLLRRRKLPTTRFVLPHSTKVAIRPLSSNPSPFPFSTVTRRVAPHRPLLIRRSLSSSQEHQPSVQSPQSAAPKVSTCPRSLPRVAEKSGTFCANKGTYSGKPQLFPRIAPLFPALLDFSCGMARLLCSIARFLLQHSTISFAFPRLTLRSPSNTQVPPSHRSPTTSSSLCSPSVNSLSTTTAAP